MKLIRYADNSNQNSKWAVGLHNEWRNGCISTSGVEFLKSDLYKPNLLEEESICAAMCKFVTELRKANEEDYPPQTIRGIITFRYIYIHIVFIGYYYLNKEEHLLIYITWWITL